MLEPLQPIEQMFGQVPYGIIARHPRNAMQLAVLWGVHFPVSGQLRLRHGAKTQCADVMAKFRQAVSFCIASVMTELV